MTMTMTMTMDLYGHLFSDAPWRAMELLPEFAGHTLTISTEEAPDAGTTEAASGL